jgi:autotransporter-associated beta strand protein
MAARGATPAVLYWDTNGASAGANLSGSASGTWNNTAALWSTDPAGAVATTTWTQGATAVFSAGTNAINVSSVALGSVVIPAAVRFEEGTVYLQSGLSSALVTDIFDVTGVNAQGRINTSVGGMSGTVTKTGPGMLVLGATNTFSGGIFLRNGTLTADFSQPTAPANNVLPSWSTLTIGGDASAQYASFRIFGGTSGAANLQTFSGTVLLTGASVIASASTSTGSATLALGTLTRNAGSITNFIRPSNGNICAITSNTNDILGGWATVGTGAASNGVFYGTDFAALNGLGQVVPYTGYTDFSLAPGNVHAQVNAATNLRITNATAGNVVVNADGAETTTDLNTINIADNNGRNLVIGEGNTLRFGKFGGVFRSGTLSAQNYTIGSAGQNVGTLTAGGAPDQRGEIAFTINNTSQSSGSVLVHAGIADNGTGGGAGAVSVIKAGPGSLKLRGHSSYSGGTYILQGRLQVAGNEIGTANPDGLGTGPVVVRPGGQAYLSGVGNASAGMSNAFIISGVGTNQEPYGAVRLGTPPGGGGVANRVSGTITLAGDARIVGDSTTDGVPNATFAGKITGPYGLEIGNPSSSFGIFSGSGVMLSNPANDFSGNTTILSSTSLYSTLRLGANEVIPDGAGNGNLVFTGTRGTLDMGGLNETVNGLSGPAGSIVENRVVGTMSTLTVGNNNASSTFAGILRHTTLGTLALTKVGTGTLTLTGVNSYQGPTRINGGILRRGSAAALGNTSSVTVNDGGALELNGQSLAQPLTIAGDGPALGAILGAVMNGPGAAQATLSGAVTLGDDATIVSANSIIVTGAFNGGGHTLTKSGASTVSITGPQTWSPGGTIIASSGPLNLSTNAGGAGGAGGAGRALNLDYRSFNSTLTFNASQSLNSLSVGEGATAMLVSNGDRWIATNGVSFPGNASIRGKLDLQDNKLIVTGGDVGTSDGATYSGLTGFIQSAHAGGAWSGGGITTRQTAAKNGLTSLGIATAAESGYAGGTFGGVSVSGSDVLVMYTYAGDANLDGFISGDDYAAIDFNVAIPGANGWYNGDFNYDGIISGDDYAAIDFNIVAQGAPFPTGAGAVSGVIRVPEPVGAAWLVAAAAVTMRRFRRNRG